MIFSSWGGSSAPAYGANMPPTVSLTGPMTGDTFAVPATIALTATAGDSDGAIANVKFFQGTTLLKQVNKPPYSFVWNHVAAGSYMLTVKATDKAGASTVSTTVPITVTNTPPTISLTAPVTGAIFSPPATITLTASASDSEGAVKNVKFFQGTTLLRQVAKAPYSFV
jgi:hypothetical protein